ncbi:MAG: amino acid permease, partial [Gammaproteobacteria bacterium]|nr:amino acid permease [Gammaproteobacteria bacterium]
ALGELAGFLTGWMYWYFWTIVVALEAVAGANLIAYWFPDSTPWLCTLILTIIFTLINLLSVRSWGESEFWFASIKVVTIIVLLILGGAYILGFWPSGGGFANLTAHGGFAPNGITPILAGAVAATAFYFGAELVTVAAAESAEPARAVARAAQSVISRVLFFYVGSIFVVVCIVPWNDADKMTQPYVSVFTQLGLPAAANVMNVVILTALLSALNSGVFGSSRILMALARRGDAPAFLAHVNSRGVPVAAILGSSAFAYVAVVMSYLSPDKVFAFLVSSYGTVAVFVYLLIALSQLVLRRRLERESPERLQFRMWAFPWLTWVAIVGMLSILTAMAFIVEQRVPLLFGVVSLLMFLLAYWLRKKISSR